MSRATRTPPTADEYSDYPRRFSNWSRWGDDDELGTLNFITDNVRRAAASLVRDGRVVSCSREVDTHAGPANPYPAQHMVAVHGQGGMIDWFGMFIHGFTQTHIDALCHLSAHQHGDVFWNNKPFGAHRMPKDHTGTIDFWRSGIVTRGVLYDIPKLRGTKWVEKGQPVQAWDLDDFAAMAGITPRSGDAVCIRSGHGAYFAAHPNEQPAFGSPSGVHASCIEFLADTEASMLVWDWQDAPIDQQGIPNPLPIVVPLHVHQVVLPYMGMPIVDNADFEQLAEVCAASGRYEFQLVVAPLYLKMGTGSPVNPIALL